MTTVEISVTGPSNFVIASRDELLRLRLIACGQVWTIESRYWWENNLEAANEVRAAMHTTRVCAVPAMDLIRSTHPYDTCFIAVQDLANADQRYASWVEENVDGSDYVEN